MQFDKKILNSPHITGEYGRLSILLDLLDIISPLDEKNQEIHDILRDLLLSDKVTPEISQILSRETDPEIALSKWLRDEDARIRKGLISFLETIKPDQKDKVMSRLSLNHNRYLTATLMRTSNLLKLTYPDKSVDFDEMLSVSDNATKLLTNQKYHILALPLVTLTKLPKELQDLAEKYAEEYGYKMFDPKNVAKTKLNGAMLCTFLYAIFKKLLLIEHEAAKRIYNSRRPEEQRSTFENMSSLGEETVQVRSIINKFSTCDVNGKVGKILNYNIVSDIYSHRDNSAVFGGFSMGPHSGFTAEKEQEEEATAPKTESKSLDEEFRRSKIHPEYDYIAPGAKTIAAVVLLDHDYTYLGHIYVWPSDSFKATMDVIGIRASLINLACRDVRNIGQKLIAGVILYASTYNGFNMIRVRQPFDNVKPILRDLRFKESRISGESDHWLRLPHNSNYLLEYVFPGHFYELMNFDCRFPFNEDILKLSPEEHKQAVDKIMTGCNKDCEKDKLLIDKYVDFLTSIDPYFYVTFDDYRSNLNRAKQLATNTEKIMKAFPPLS